MTATVQIPDVQRVAVLAGEEQLRNHAVLHHVRRAPLARDHGVVTEVPPEVVRQLLRSAIFLPSPFDLECLGVEHEDAAGRVAVGVAKGVDVNAVRPAVHRVRPAVAGLLNDLLRLDHLDEARLPWVRRGVENVDARRSHAGHDEIAPLHVRVWRVWAQARAARVPPEVMQLVAGIRHVNARDLGAISRRRGIDVEHRKGVVDGRVGIEQRHVRERLRRGLHGHRRRRVKALVGKQFRHCRDPSRGFQSAHPETRIERAPASFENAGSFLKLS